MDPKLIEKKILFFTPETIPSNSGAGLNCFNFAGYLASYTKKITICALNYNSELPEKEIINKVAIWRITYYNSNLFLKILSLPHLLFQYSRHIINHHCVFIYSGYLIGYEWIVFLCLLYRRKIIFRSSDLNGDDMEFLLKRYGIFKPLIKILFRKISMYFSINREFSNRYRNVIKKDENLFESFQGVNELLFHPVTQQEKTQLRRKLQLPLKTPLIISSGYVIKRKGYHYLFEQLSKIKIPFLYLVAGDYHNSAGHRVPPHEKSEMKELYEKGIRLLGDKILFTGPKQNIAEYLQASDIFLHGSLKEGTPNILLEAMACRLLTVMKKLEGINDKAIKNKVHVLDFESYEELPFIIQSCLEDISGYKQVSENGYQLILNNFTFEKVATKLFNQLYSK